MNILFIAYSFSPNRGGVQRVTDLLTRQFISIGHHVSYLFATSEFDDSPEKFPVPCFVMDKPLSVSFDKDSIHLYHSILLQNKIDIIIHQYPLLKKGDFFFKNALPGITKISCFHGSPFGSLNYFYRTINLMPLYKRILTLPKYFLQTFILKKRFIQINKQSDYQCFLASSYVRDVSNIVAYSNRGKIVHIPNPNTFEVQTESYNKDNLILFVGRVSDPVKNLIDFIKVWEKLYSVNPTWKALIIGDDSNCKSLQDYIKVNQIQHIAFVGHTDHISSYYKKAKIICMTSHHEGWPMVLTEAMSYGCVPFAYSTFGAIYDLIEDKQTGFIIEPYNIDEMVNNLETLMHSDNEYEIMSQKAQEYIKQFSVETIAKKWINLFKK